MDFDIDKYMNLEQRFRKILSWAATIKILATFGAWILIGLHEFLMCFSSFTFPYILLATPDPIAFILPVLVLYALLWITTWFTVRAWNDTVFLISAIGIILLNISDIVFCVISYAEPIPYKVINIFISFAVIVISCIPIILQQRRFRKFHRQFCK